MKVRMCAIFVCMFAIAVIAQSVDGKWTGEVQGGRGPQPVTLTLKADGGKLTGYGDGRSWWRDTRFRKARSPVRH